MSSQGNRNYEMPASNAVQVEEKKPVEKKSKKVLTPAEQFQQLKDSLPEDKEIKVVAIRDGFYKGHRRPEGSIFSIEGREFFGTWMKPI